jgi:hypothetical protein
MEDGGALLERADSGAAGDEDHDINDRFSLGESIALLLLLRGLPTVSAFPVSR